jgi:myo-inositol-1(or 4)-monophosphatase
MTELNNDPYGSGEFSINPEDFVFLQGLLIQGGTMMLPRILGHDFETEWKPDNTPVTTVDLGLADFYNTALHSRHPNDRIYNEEGGVEPEGEFSGNTWVVDPTDGTQSLEQGINAVTSCAARVGPDGKTLYAAVNNPVKDELFAVMRGMSATMNGDPIHVSEKSALKSSYIYLGSRIRREDLASNGIVYDRLENDGAKVFNVRALAFGCTQVARGRAEGAFIGVDNPLEAASVSLLVEAAGGKVTDLYGNPPGRMDGPIKGLVVSNGLIHDQLLEALHKS